MNFISRVIVKLNGGIWKFKEKIKKRDNSKLKNFYIKLYDDYFGKFGSWIGYTSTFKGMPCFPHGYYGVFISGQAEIGKNCVIFHQVTIGSNTIPGSKGRGSPIIGDNCYIGAGVKIIGGIKVGKNCRIGANCIVTKDIPDNSIVVMEKPRVIFKENMLNKFYSQKNGKWVYFDNGTWLNETDEKKLNLLNQN